MAVDAAQSTVSSSSTLWAQASKEWVIPAKPKPGRKPKKDPAPPKESQEVEAKGRRVQNRAAQRAFRERKQSQLADLQARVQSYEQGEIERNVALQQISKRLKDENEQLKAENTSLKEELARLKDRLESAAAKASSSRPYSEEEKSKKLKRWRDESICSILSDETSILLEPVSRKRCRADTGSPGPSMTPAPSYGHAAAYVPSPPSLASTPDSTGMAGAPYSPMAFTTLPAPSGSVNASAMYSSALFTSPTRDTTKGFDSLGGTPPFDTFDCGLCTDNTPCVCREIAMQNASVVSEFTQEYLLPPPQSSNILKTEELDRTLITPSAVIEIPPADEQTSAAQNIIQSSSNNVSPTKINSSSKLSVPLRRSTISQPTGPIQIRLPSPEPAPVTASSSRSVPLPLKNSRRSANKIWQINPPPPTCSGDPSNCPACKDDDFGKAFCRALETSSAITAAPACASCPNPEACGKLPRSAFGLSAGSNSKPPLGGDPNIAELTPVRSEKGHIPTASASRPSVTLPPINIDPIGGPHVNSTTNGTPLSLIETIPVNEAWARLKSHPNIAFADLSMLADVVARRTKCSGPVTVIHPAPGSLTPERGVIQDLAPENSNETSKLSHEPEKGDGDSIVLTDPHALFRTQEKQRTQNTSRLTESSSGPSSVPIASRIPSASADNVSRASDRPALVPQEELRECGRRRIREVDAAGVREALRILDAQFGKHA